MSKTQFKHYQSIRDSDHDSWAWFKPSCTLKTRDGIMNHITTQNSPSYTYKHIRDCSNNIKTINPQNHTKSHGQNTFMHMQFIIHEKLPLPGLICLKKMKGDSSSWPKLASLNALTISITLSKHLSIIYIYSIIIKGIPLFVSTFHNTHFTLSYFKN